MADAYEWTGTEWASIPDWNVYDGTAFQEAEGKYWDGTEWVTFTTTWVENFEWGGPLSDRYTAVESHALDNVSINAQSARSGAFGLHMTELHAGGHFISLPGDGGDYYPSAGDTFEVWFQSNFEAGSPSLARIHWFCQAYNTNNLYRVNINPNEIVLQKRRNGSTTGLEQMPVTFPAGAWRGIQVETTEEDGLTQTVTVMDESRTVLNSMTGTDSNPYLSGGIGFFSNANWDVYVDDWSIVD